MFIYICFRFYGQVLLLLSNLKIYINIPEAQLSVMPGSESDEES